MILSDVFIAPRGFLEHIEEIFAIFETCAMSFYFSFERIL